MKRTVQSLRKLKIFRVGTYKYRSNSNDGRSKAYLWFSVSYLRYKNTIVTSIKISFNLSDNLLVY